MANRRALWRLIFGGVAGRLLDNGDGTYAPLVATAPGTLAAQASALATAPAAGTVIATTGALPAGDYRIEAELSSNDGAAGKYLIMTRRNAADAANIVPFAAVCGAGHLSVVWSRISLALNERVSIRADVAGTAAALYAGNIRAYRLA